MQNRQTLQFQQPKQSSRNIRMIKTYTADQTIRDSSHAASSSRLNRRNRSFSSDKRDDDINYTHSYKKGQTKVRDLARQLLMESHVEGGFFKRTNLSDLKITHKNLL